MHVSENICRRTTQSLGLVFFFSSAHKTVLEPAVANICSEICMIECAWGILIVCERAKSSHRVQGTQFKIHPTEESVVLQTLKLAKHCFSCRSCNKHPIHQPGQRKYGLECSFNQFKQTGSPPRPVLPKKCINLSGNFHQFLCRHNLLDTTLECMFWVMSRDNLD